MLTIPKGCCHPHWYVPNFRASIVDATFAMLSLGEHVITVLVMSAEHRQRVQIGL